MSKALALFDFDGTITTGDTLSEFIIFVKGRWYFYWGCIFLAPIVTFFKLGLVSRQRAKEAVLSFYFRSMPITQLQSYCTRFVDKHLPHLINPKALERIKIHLNNGDRVVVVSASPEHWVQPWADSIGIEAVATRLEVSDGKFTGKILGENCHGLEKVRRIGSYLSLADYDPIYTYGDSRSDFPFLKTGNICFYKSFRKGALMSKN